jgi:hypothetical protein
MPALPLAQASSFAEIIEVDWCGRTIPPGTEWEHHWRDGSNIVLSLARQGADYWLRIPGIADVLLQLQPVCRVLVSRHAASRDAATLEHQLVDQVLPRLLAQRGELLVHASALAINDHHALFLGPSGWGKSTLAGLLQRLGHAVLSDDCVQIDLAHGQVGAIPTYPSLRLNADSLDTLFPGVAETTPVASYSEKRRVRMPPPPNAGSAVPVDALYLLGDPDQAGNSVRITALRPIETCMALIKHSFRLDLGDRAATTEQLQRCSVIARSMPAFRLDYPRDYALHEALTGAISEHLASLPRPD